MIMLSKNVNQTTLNHNPLKLSFINIPSFSSNFVDCETFLKLIFPDILVLCKEHKDNSLEPSNFSM